MYYFSQILLISGSALWDPTQLNAGSSTYHTNAVSSIAFIAFWSAAKSNPMSVSVCNGKMMNSFIYVIKS